MGKKIRCLLASALLITSMSVPAFATGSLDDAISTNQTQVETSVDTNQEQSNQGISNSSQSNSSSSSNRQARDMDFINGMNAAADLTADIDGANEITGAVKKFVGKIIGFIFFTIPVLLTLRVALDLTYIGVPFLRKALGNGHAGSAPAGGQGGMSGGMGMGGMSGGFGGMSGGMGGMSGGMGAQNAGGLKVQLVSNAALNAVAAEKAQGPDAPGPFKIYIKDMVVVLTLIPVLIVLASTGILTTVGLTIGSFLVDFISNIKGMI